MQGLRDRLQGQPRKHSFFPDTQAELIYDGRNIEHMRFPRGIHGGVGLDTLSVSVPSHAKSEAYSASGLK